MRHAPILSSLWTARGLRPDGPSVRNYPRGYSTAPRFAQVCARASGSPVTRKVNWVSIILGVGWTLIPADGAGHGWPCELASDPDPVAEIIGFFPLFAMFLLAR